MEFAVMLYQLLLAHAVTDFALQSKEMAVGKRGQGDVPPGVIPVTVWPFWLVAHGAVNAAGVYLVTGSIVVSVMELCLHVVIDRAKTLNKTTVYEDQALHLASKIFYAYMLT